MGIAQRLERDRDLSGPALIEALAARLPDRVPVAVHLALVRDQAVEQPAQGVRVEEEGVAPVVERVQHHSEVLVLPEVDVVAAHLVGDHPLGLAVPHAPRHVDVLLVEEDPRLRQL